MGTWRLYPGIDWQRMLWHWSQQSTRRGRSIPALYLGYGTEDLYLSDQGLLREILPQENSYTSPGGHSPNTMKKYGIFFLRQM